MKVKKISGFRKLARYSVQNKNPKQSSNLTQSVTGPVSSMLARQKSSDYHNSVQASRFKNNFDPRISGETKMLMRAKSHGPRSNSKTQNGRRFRNPLFCEISSEIYQSGQKRNLDVKITAKKEIEIAERNQDKIIQKIENLEVKRDYKSENKEKSQIKNGLDVLKADGVEIACGDNKSIDKEVNIYDYVQNSLKKGSDQKINLYSKSNIKKQLDQNEKIDRKLKDKSKSDAKIIEAPNKAKISNKSDGLYLDFKEETNLKSQAYDMVISKNEIKPKGKIEMIGNNIILKEPQTIIKTRRQKLESQNKIENESLQNDLKNKEVSHDIKFSKKPKKSKKVSKRASIHKKQKSSKNISDVKSKTPSMTRFVDYFDEKGGVSLNLESQKQIAIAKKQDQRFEDNVPKKIEKRNNLVTNDTNKNIEPEKKTSTNSQRENQNSRNSGHQVNVKKNLKTNSKRGSKHHYKHLKKNRNSRLDSGTKGISNGNKYIRSFKSPISKKSISRFGNNLPMRLWETGVGDRNRIGGSNIETHVVSKRNNNLVRKPKKHKTTSNRNVTQTHNHLKNVNRVRNNVKSRKGSRREIKNDAKAHNKINVKQRVDKNLNNFQPQAFEVTSNFEVYSKNSSHLNFRESKASKTPNRDSNAKSEFNNYVKAEGHKKSKSNFDFDPRNFPMISNQFGPTTPHFGQNDLLSSISSQSPLDQIKNSDFPIQYVLPQQKFIKKIRNTVNHYPVPKAQKHSFTGSGKPNFNNTISFKNNGSSGIQQFLNRHNSHFGGSKYEPVSRIQNFTKSNILRGIPRKQKRKSQGVGQRAVKADLSPRIMSGVSGDVGYYRGKRKSGMKGGRVQNITGKRFGKDSQRISGVLDVDRREKKKGYKKKIGSQIDLIADNLQR